MAKFIVNVIASACVDIEVEAHDAKEAEALALKAANPSLFNDWDYEVDYVDKDEEE